MSEEKKAAAAALSEDLAGKSLEEFLAWSLERFPGGALVLASSFGPEDVILLDAFDALGRFPRVVTLDTGRLPQATHDLVVRMRERFPALSLETHFPDAETVGELVGRHGPNLFYESPELRRLCCRVRKVEPLRRALTGAKAWITGVRRDQSADRASAALVEWDAEFGLRKLNPLAEWTSARVWSRIREKRLPYNRLHDQGYPSVGCEPCTRAVAPGADPRSGRWWWENPTGVKECGLHRSRA